MLNEFELRRQFQKCNEQDKLEVFIALTNVALDTLEFITQLTTMIDFSNGSLNAEVISSKINVLAISCKEHLSKAMEITSANKDSSLHEQGKA